MNVCTHTHTHTRSSTYADQRCAHHLPRPPILMERGLGVETDCGRFVTWRKQTSRAGNAARSLLPTPCSLPLQTRQRGQVISVFHKLKAAAVAVAAKVMKTEERKKKRHLDCNRSVSVEQADHPHSEWEKRSTRKWPSAGARWGVRKRRRGAQPGAMGPLSQCTNTKRNATIKRFKFAAFRQQKQSQSQWQRRSNRKRKKKKNASNYFY